jgi:putative peptidoglycan lipid II flippase
LLLEVFLSSPSQLSPFHAENPLTRAVDHPLVRGGLTLVAGTLTGNALGFVRVALTAYFLGTHSRADSLAVAMGPVDTLNSVLINSIVFAFVPLLTGRNGAARAALFRRLSRDYFWLSAALSGLVIATAPWLMRALAPGLDGRYFETAVMNLRLLSLSSVAAGTGAVQCALLYTDRRFAPTAFYQAALNAFTSIAALALWKFLGVYAFAVGYTLGAWVQLAIVWFAARPAGAAAAGDPPSEPIHWRDVLARPAFFAVYAAGLGLNVTFTRAWATHAGPGMAASLDYCLRGVGVPLAILVNPISNSLLPEIARLRSLGRLRDALRLIDKTILFTALLSVGGCAFALLFREPAIRLFFQRGQFTAESTRMASAVYLGLAPSLVGWSLIEIASRSLFAVDRPWPPVVAVAVPIICNVVFTFWMRTSDPQWLGGGASLGLLLGFVVLFTMLHAGRKRWV